MKLRQPFLRTNCGKNDSVKVPKNDLYLGQINASKLVPMILILF
jgi:hypothetical protein